MGTRSWKLNPRCAVEPLESRRLLSAASVPAPASAVAPGAPLAGLTPIQVRGACGLDHAFFGSIRADGRGQTIAVVTAYDDPNIAKDLAHFDSSFDLGAPRSFRKLNENGGTVYPAQDASWAARTAQDVEWAHAIAPAANLLLVEADSPSVQNRTLAVNVARRAVGVSVVLTSWGNAQLPAAPTPGTPSNGPEGRGGVTLVSAPAGASPDAFHAVAAPAGPDRGFAIYTSVAYRGRSGWWTASATGVGAAQLAGLITLADQGRALHGLPLLSGPAVSVPALLALADDAFHDGPPEASTGVHRADGGLGSPPAPPDAITLIRILSELPVATPSKAPPDRHETPDTSHGGAPPQLPRSINVTALPLTPQPRPIAAVQASISPASGSAAGNPIGSSAPTTPTSPRTGVPARIAGIAAAAGPVPAEVEIANAIAPAAGALANTAADHVSEALAVLAGGDSLAGPIALGFVHLSPEGIFPRELAGFVEEWASLPAASMQMSASIAWDVTAAVVAADAILLGLWYRRRRSQPHIELFSDRLL